MPVNIGVNIQRSPNRINQQLREAGVEGKFPKLLLDFKDQYYLASGGSKTLANAVTHARSGNAVMTDGYGPELVTNGTFDTDSNWTDESNSGASASIVDGLAILQGNNSRFTQNITTVVGKTYFVDATVTGAGSAMHINVFDDSDTSLLEIDYDAGDTGGAFTATSTTTEVMLYGYGSGITKFDNVSVREMPVLKWAPHNLLSYSEDLGNWTNFNTTDSLDQIAAPDGTTTADKVVEDSSSAVHNIYQTGITVVSGVDYTFCTFVKQGEYKWVQLSFALSNSTFTANDFANFDVNSGTVGTTGSGATATIEDVGSGWYKCSVTATAAASASSGATICLTDNTDASSRNPSYAGDGSSGIYVWGMHFNRGDLGGMVDNPERGDSYVPTAVRPAGANLVTGFVNGTTYPYDTLITDGTEVTSAITDGSNFAGMASNGITVSTDKAYVVTFDLTLNSGDAPQVYFVNSQSGGATAKSNTETSVSGSNTITLIPTASETVYLQIRNTNGSSANFSTTAMSVRESAIKPNAARYLPRIGHHVYNGSAWVNEGLLAESEARTNLLGYSENFTTGNWNYTANITRTADQAISPAGTETADKVVATSTSGLHYIGIASSISSGSGNEVFSFYVKPSGINNIQVVLSNQTGSYSQIFNLSEGTLGTIGSGNVSQSIQDVGNGWYRCAMGYTSTKANPYPTIRLLDDSFNSTFTGNDTDGILLWGGQLESGATPSSYIPSLANTANTVTRAAETFTIPSANLPWPSPQYIGSELVSNGDFSNGTTNWEKRFTVTDLSVVNGALRLTEDGSDDSSSARAFQTITTVVGKIYYLSVDYLGGTGSGALFVNTSFNFGGAIASKSSLAVGTHTIVFVATATTTYIILGGGNSAQYNDFDNISVREINPLSVSIAMDGRATFADTGTYAGSFPYLWDADNNNAVAALIRGDGANAGKIDVEQKISGVRDVVTAGRIGDPDVLVPYKIAQRSGSTFLNGAVNGVEATANTTPTALVDLSATDLDLAETYMGTIGTFRVWDRDIADTGLVEATNPSLEPSLSLTFEGTGTNSFIVNDWSE